MVTPRKALALAPAILLFAAVLRTSPESTLLTLWPGYTIALPATYCVELSRGPDFDVLYFRDSNVPKRPILVGVYAGHNPREFECSKAATRTWSNNGLSFKSARGSEGCAEFLVRDPEKPERGVVHIWFGPRAKDQPQLAERVVESVRRSSLPVYRPDNLPACK